MLQYPLPHNETERLAALYKTGLLDSQDDPDFNDIALLASNICKTPVALITMVAADRVWFKAKVGTEDNQVSRRFSFCTHTIAGDDLLIVEDATGDERFYDNPLITGELQIKYYAGQPIVTTDGYRLGTLCVMDQVSRQLDEVQKTGLRVLAELVAQMIELRNRNGELKTLNDLMHRIATVTVSDTKGPVTALQTIILMNSTIHLTKQDLQAVLPIADRQLKSTLELLNNLVEWGKLQIDKHETVDTPFSLSDIVSACFEEFKSNAGNKGNTLVNDVPSGIKIKVDDNAIRFILRNLVNNSIKFTSNGVVSVGYNRQDNEHHIIIKDTGIGMVPLNQDFSRGIPNYTKRPGTNKEKGSGLGLVLIGEQLRAMKGSMYIESKPGEGTVVIVSLPE